MIQIANMINIESMIQIANIIIQVSIETSTVRFRTSAGPEFTEDSRTEMTPLTDTASWASPLRCSVRFPSWPRGNHGNPMTGPGPGIW